jgi:hypothetical protein
MGALDSHEDRIANSFRNEFNRTRHFKKSKNVFPQASNEGVGMKRTLWIQFSVVAIALAFASRPVYAEDKIPHAKHKQESGVMDSAHMKEMMGRRSECLNMHPDGEICDHQMMEDCQKKTGEGECQEIMKQAKAQKQPTAHGK